jgi:general secretion pathway protein F
VTAPEPTSHSSASLEQLIALNDEIAALVRAGVPLSGGLDLVSRDLPGRLGRLSAALAGRLEAGESLPQALAASPGVFSPVYAAVVEAGIASGRLPTALEELSTSLRRVAELRRMTASALVYPLLVLLIMYVLFLFSIVRLQPQVRSAYASFDVPESRWNVWLVELGQSAAAWGPWLPVAVAVPLALAWYWSGRSVARPGGLLSRLFGRAWPANQLRRCSGLAAFADLLALMLQHEVPLDRALRLAGEASGDAQLRVSARQLADASRRGAVDSAGTPAGFPPLIGWLLASGNAQPALAASLRHTAEAYRRRAERLDDWLRLYLPIGLTLAIGGTVVVFYALSVFVPWYGLLDQFATNPGS